MTFYEKKVMLAQKFKKELSELRNQRDIIRAAEQRRPFYPAFVPATAGVRTRNEQQNKPFADEGLAECVERINAV